MTRAELEEIRGLLIAQEALAAERSRGLMDRLQHLFRAPRRVAPAPAVSASSEPVAAEPEPVPLDQADILLFEPLEEEAAPPRRQFGRRDDALLQLDAPLLLTPPAPTCRPMLSPWPQDEHPAEPQAEVEDDGGAPYLADDLLDDDTTWRDQALFEATIADWAETLPDADARDARGILLRLEAMLRIEREALERQRILKAA